MSIDGPNRSEDPAAIGTAVRKLATDSHLILTRAAASGPDDHREALDDLLRRIEDLQRLLGENRPGENRLHSIRIWLDNLQPRPSSCGRWKTSAGGWNASNTMPPRTLEVGNGDDPAAPGCRRSPLRRIQVGNDQALGDEVNDLGRAIGQLNRRILIVLRRESRFARR